MANKINLDTSAYPKILISVEEEINEGDVEEFYGKLVDFLEELDNDFVVISDQTNGKFMAGKTRILLGKRLQQISQQFKARELGVVVINNSIIGAMMIKGIMLLSGAQRNFYVVNSREEAHKKADEVLHAEMV